MSDADDAQDPPTPKTQPWPACGNCGRPAYVMLEGYPACIDCKYKVDIGHWMAWTQHATMLNYASQEMDMLVGMGVSPRIEIPRPPVPPINYNNQTVSVSGGTVGSINFGNVREIQVNLQALTSVGQQDIVEPLSKLTDAILNAQDADEPTKNEILEQIASLTALANKPREGRKLGMVKAVFGAIREGAGAIGSAAGAWKVAEPLLKGHFGL